TSSCAATPTKRPPPPGWCRGTAVFGSSSAAPRSDSIATARTAGRVLLLLRLLLLPFLLQRVLQVRGRGRRVPRRVALQVVLEPAEHPEVVVVAGGGLPVAVSFAGIPDEADGDVPEHLQLAIELERLRRVDARVV